MVMATRMVEQGCAVPHRRMEDMLRVGFGRKVRDNKVRYVRGIWSASHASLAQTAAANVGALQFLIVILFKIIGLHTRKVG